MFIESSTKKPRGEIIGNSIFRTAFSARSTSAISGTDVEMKSGIVLESMAMGRRGALQLLGLVMVRDAWVLGVGLVIGVNVKVT